MSQGVDTDVTSRSLHWHSSSLGRSCSAWRSDHVRELDPVAARLFGHRRPGGVDNDDGDCDEDDQSSRGSGDFDNYEDDDHDDGDVRLIEQNMTIPSQLDDLQL